jgi:hypothetical protein
MIPSTPFTSFTTKPGFVRAEEPHFRFGLSSEVENFYAGYFLYETKGATMECVAQGIIETQVCVLQGPFLVFLFPVMFSLSC